MYYHILSVISADHNPNPKLNPNTNPNTKTNPNQEIFK